MKDAEYVKNQIYQNGFMTESQIKIRVDDHKKIIKEIKRDQYIHEVKYTNIYVCDIAVKKLYIFNPRKKKRTKSKK